MEAVGFMAVVAAGTEAEAGMEAAVGTEAVGMEADGTEADGMELAGVAIMAGIMAGVGAELGFTASFPTTVMAIMVVIAKE